VALLTWLVAAISLRGEHAAPAATP
jgi:hypothetical protein